MDKLSSSSLPNVRAAFLESQSAPALDAPFSEFISRVRRAEALQQLPPEEALAVLRAGALFGGLLAATSRAELVRLAEGGDPAAGATLRELFGTRVIYPGTFDPFTRGHGDVVRRAVKLFGEVLIAVGVNPGKGGALFTVDERIALIKQDLADLGDRVQVASFEGSLVGLARKLGCNTVLRGIRSVTDYEQELQLALVNLMLSKDGVETLFIAAREGSSYVSSSTVKSVVKVDEDASSMVSAPVLEALHAKRRKGAL